jgi:hypothetical protein
VLTVRDGKATAVEKRLDILPGVKHCPENTDEPKRFTPKRVSDGEIAMGASEREAALAQL